MNKYVEIMSAGFGEDYCGYCLSSSMILIFTSNISIAILSFYLSCSMNTVFSREDTV